MKFSLMLQSTQMNILYTNCFRRDDKDDKYYYYLSLSKVTKENITNKICKVNCLY